MPCSSTTCSEHTNQLRHAQRPKDPWWTHGGPMEDPGPLNPNRQALALFQPLYFNVCSLADRQTDRHCFIYFLPLTASPPLVDKETRAQKSSVAGWMHEAFR
jgi:hypothetical protein